VPSTSFLCLVPRCQHASDHRSTSGKCVQSATRAGKQSSATGTIPLTNHAPTIFSSTGRPAALGNMPLMHALTKDPTLLKIALRLTKSSGPIQLVSPTDMKAATTIHVATSSTRLRHRPAGGPKFLVSRRAYITWHADDAIDAQTFTASSAEPGGSLVRLVASSGTPRRHREKTTRRTL